MKTLDLMNSLSRRSFNCYFNFLDSIRDIWHGRLDMDFVSWRMCIQVCLLNRSDSRKLIDIDFWKFTHYQNWLKRWGLRVGALNVNKMVNIFLRDHLSILKIWNEMALRYDRPTLPLYDRIIGKLKLYNSSSQSTKA